jgi:hypothetical protein
VQNFFAGNYQPWRQAVRLSDCTLPFPQDICSESVSGFGCTGKHISAQSGEPSAAEYQEKYGIKGSVSIVECEKGGLTKVVCTCHCFETVIGFALEKASA